MSKTTERALKRRNTSEHFEGARNVRGVGFRIVAVMNQAEEKGQTARGERQDRDVLHYAEGCGGTSDRFVLVGTNQGVDGDVLISVRPVDRPEDEFTFATNVVDGGFEAVTKHQLSGTVEVQAHYLGGFGLCACESWIEKRDV